MGVPTTTQATSTSDLPTQQERNTGSTHTYTPHTPLTHITLTPFPPTGGAAGSVAGENEEEEEETEEVDPIWGPLKEPVNIKLADLGNACWVVSTHQRSTQQSLSYQP